MNVAVTYITRNRVKGVLITDCDNIGEAKQAVIKHESPNNIEIRTCKVVPQSRTPIVWSLTEKEL